MRTVRFFFSLPRSRLKCFHAVLSYRRSPSSPPRLARLIRKRLCGDDGVERYILAAVCYFFSRGCLHRTERPGNESFRSSRFILQHLRDVSIWSIQCAYIYMVIRYTVYRAIHQNAHPLFLFNNLKVIQSSNF